MKIYRVMRVLLHKHLEAETSWHSSKKYCEQYIANSPYKQHLYIDTQELIEDTE